MLLLKTKPCMPSNKKKQFSLNLRTAPHTSCKLQQACFVNLRKEGHGIIRITLVILRLIRERKLFIDRQRKVDGCVIIVEVLLGEVAHLDRAKNDRHFHS